MIKLRLQLIAKYSQHNICPIISRFQPYDPLMYSTYFRNRFKSYTINRPNAHQIDQHTIIKLLQTQITQDKILFHKQKQILFIGRSNSGKSSLLNTLFNQKMCKGFKLTKGTTRYLHFHGLANNKGMLVDTPGYGFANMNKRRRNLWFGSVFEYLKVSSRVSQIFLCASTMLGLMPNDIEVLKRINELNVNIQIVLTKCDKIKEDKLYYRMIETAKTLEELGFKNISDRIHTTSIRTKFGIEELKQCMAGALIQSRQRNIDGKEDMLLEYLKDNRIQEVDIKEKERKMLTKPHLIRKLIYNSSLAKYLK